MKITKVQAEALATFARLIRPDWGHPGIMAALEKAAATADVHDVACALIRLAEDATVKTPGMLPQPGPHWLKPDGTKPARRGDHAVTCPEHGERMPCGRCIADTGAPPAEVLGDIRAALDAAKTTHHQREAEQAAREELRRI